MVNNFSIKINKMVTLGKRIQGLRKKGGLTQQELAKK